MTILKFLRTRHKPRNLRSVFIWNGLENIYTKALALREGKLRDELTHLKSVEH